MVILGFIGEALQNQKEKLFAGYEELGNILWVNTKQELQITHDEIDKAMARHENGNKAVNEKGTEKGTCREANAPKALADEPKD